MISFSDFCYVNDLDQIVVRIPTEHIPRQSILNEGRWAASGEKDWMLRVDPADPAIPSQRHVHIARAKHISAKNQQVSWNEDKTRHDKRTFNTSVAAISAVKKIARAALALEDDAILEHIEFPPDILSESHTIVDDKCVVYFAISTP